jgi:hypothetical protein
MTLPEGVSNYISKRAFNHWNLEWEEVSGIELVVVVPAICEFENIKKLLPSLNKQSQTVLQKTVVIFVINNHVSSEQLVRDDNNQTIEFLRALISNNSREMQSKEIIESGLRLGLIDAASEGNELDDKNAGVGLARKIGMDKALQVFDYSIEGKKVIVSLDADCTVEDNYLSDIQNYFRANNSSVALVDFEHSLPVETINKISILTYEIFLRHYIVGLHFAQSPFAFHTIGSTIICDHEAYIQVGGMNTKKAAEDFYFLQKLAKHYKVKRIVTTTVKPSARESWRVPFGTGKSMTDYLKNKKMIFVFDPQVYVILKQWLQTFNSDLLLKPDLILDEAIKIHPELYNFLSNRSFKKDWEKILENTKTSRQLDYQRKNWFDAFETLKLIHHMRDTAFPSMDIKTGVEKLFNLTQHSFKFESGRGSNSELQTLEHYLSEVKSLENNLYKGFYK